MNGPFGVALECRERAMVARLRLSLRLQVSAGRPGKVRQNIWASECLLTSPTRYWSLWGYLQVGMLPRKLMYQDSQSALTRYKL
jgi:hypothetical protein